MSHRADLFVAVQRLLPKHFLSRLIARLAESKQVWLKNSLIKVAIKAFGINMQEALSNDLNDYENFNAFFTRSLKPEARPIDCGDNNLVSPADGTVSQIGRIENNKLLQAKGSTYSVNHLIGNHNQAKVYSNGSFATIYLSPKDYHRVHIPASGQLISTRYIPGELFSVNQKTVEALPQLFARNERLVCEFKSQQIGVFSVIFVGAMLVAGIETVWGGLEVPDSGSVRERDFSAQHLTYNKGDEIGHFKFGSTVILLFREDRLTLDEGIQPLTTLHMGQTIATY